MHVQSLFRYVYYLCGDRELAEDTVQDVFVKYWEKMDTVEPNKVKNYLYRSAKNSIINHAEHKKVVLKFEAQLKTKTDKNSPEYQLEVNEFKGQLEKAISDLPENQREVFLMHRMDGLKYKEISEILGIGQKAIEKRMRLALLELRKLYDKL